MEKKYFFEPYKGELYGKPNNFFNGKKVLVIGNSHHCDKEYDIKNRCGSKCCNYSKDCHEFTEGVIQWYLQNPKGTGLEPEQKNWRKTYTKFAWTFKHGCDRKYFFESIVFYNFLQRAVKDDKAQGSPEEIEISRPLVMAAIRELDPDIVILWGKEHVFNHLPNDQWIPGKNDRVGYYRINNRDIKVICLDHPAYAGYEKQLKILMEGAPELISNIS